VQRYSGISSQSYVQRNVQIRYYHSRKSWLEVLVCVSLNELNEETFLLRNYE